MLHNNPPVYHNSEIRLSANLIYFTPYRKTAIIKIILMKIINEKGGERMVQDMGMTNKQFQGFIRLALELLEKALQKSPDNEDLKKVRDIFQSMLEDN